MNRSARLCSREPRRLARRGTCARTRGGSSPNCKVEHKGSQASRRGKAVTTSKLALNSVTSDRILDGAVGSADVANGSLAAVDLGPDSVNSSELGTGSVGADALRSPHLHFSNVTNIADTTAHDGAYAFATATVSCGVGEDLLSVAVDWTDDNGHNERNFSGVGTSNFGTNPQTAVVETNFDGGGAGNPAQFRAVAICIF